MFRTALLILSGNAAASLLLLARNLIIARLIPVADYGIAATFAITMAMVEMMSALGLQQQIVQSKDGDNQRFQAGLQGFQVLRGVIAAVVLFLLADPIASFLRTPDVAWAYQVMALVPLFNALQHFDIHRLNRQMRFWPMVLTGAVPALVSLALVWPLYLWFGDYQVMLWAIIVQIGLMTLVSHLVAERRYSLVLDKSIMAGSLRFGWPLLVNGILLFAVFNGDKLIVGRELGLEALAIFAMGITLTLTPTIVMAKSAQNFFLPQLSAAEQGSQKFARLSAATVEASLVMGILLVAGVVLVGQPLVYALLGEKYQALLPLITWFAVLQAVRVFKAGPAIAAMAIGQTGNAMAANMVRISVLPVIWYVATTSGDILTILWIGLLGEALGHIVAMTLLVRRAGLTWKPYVLPHLASVIFLGLAVSLVPSMTSTGQAWTPTIGMAIVIIVAMGGALGTMTALRRYIVTRSDHTGNSTV